MVLEWRKRVNAGTLLGPTIYTAGPFVNEPRVNTPDEVERDIMAQAQVGYDLIKFHELLRTTTGLSRPAYLRIDEMLQERQSVAHVGMLNNIYFLPLASNKLVLLVTAGASLVLICTAP